MVTTTLKIGFGLKSTKAPIAPSEPGYIAAMQRQVKTLEDEVRSIIQQFEEVSPEVMLEALQPTFERSQAICPYKTGELRNSGYLEDTSSKGKPRVEIGYAYKGKPRYAVYVHEILQYGHEAPTQAKFLERPVMEDLPNIYYRLGAGYAEFAGFVGTPTEGY